MSLSPIAVPSDPTTDPALLDRLADAAAGHGPLLLPHAPGSEVDVPGPDEMDSEILPAGGGVAVGTSGSTGVAKRVVLAAPALAASADATHSRLGGPGQWLLSMPPHHIAGLQVLLRSLRAGHAPATSPPGSFTPETFVAGVGSLTAPRRYGSLVPTQLLRVLDSGEATRAARSLDAILVGGSATRPDLLRRAAEAGLRIVTTYGMSETAGGCVYDGTPLPGVGLRFEEGRIHLTGGMLAAGYLIRRADSPFVDHDGRRWFRTDDIGRLDEQGRLVVEGRADDVIISGGLKVWPAEVERVLGQALPEGDGWDLVVVGVPHPEWGQSVAVAVEGPGTRGEEVRARLLAHARAALPPQARPRIVQVLAALPRRGPGKPDRARIASLLAGRKWDNEVSTPEERS